MKDYTSPIPYWATHPGELLWRELEARHIKPKTFSKISKIDYRTLKKILRCKADIDDEIASKLDVSLGIDKGMWIRLQDSYYFDLGRGSKKEKHPFRCLW